MEEKADGAEEEGGGSKQIGMAGGDWGRGTRDHWVVAARVSTVAQGFLYHAVKKLTARIGAVTLHPTARNRSEERRVGKECLL